MSKSLRLSETWYRRGLWGVAVLLAWFLTGLGGVVIRDLPKVEKTLQLDDFLDRAEAEALRGKVKASGAEQRELEQALEQAELMLAKMRTQTDTQQRSLRDWLATRQVTGDAVNDPEVLARTRALDQQRAREQAAAEAVEARQQTLLDFNQDAGNAQYRLGRMEADAHQRLVEEQHRMELRVFLYRLLLTLPLLLIAAWLFVRFRKGTYWPFVWGFVFFATFVFFFELVPYLPSYGGYVRYGVGVVGVLVVGSYVIRALNRYMEKQKAAEAKPEQERRRELSYDAALVRLGKGVCPGCERAVKLDDGKTDFCPHCGIALFVHCTHCDARKSAFTHYCFQCGSRQCER